MSSSHSRITIRCPKCEKEGSARAELLNRRVSCKHCTHVFRVTPVDGSPAPGHAADADDDAAPHSLSHDDMVLPSVGHVSSSSASAIIPGTPAFNLNLAGKPDLNRELASEVEALRSRLTSALDRAKQAETVATSLQAEIRHLHDEMDRSRDVSGEHMKVRLREDELTFLREQLDKARSEVEGEARKRREAAQALSTTQQQHASVIESLQKEIAETQARLAQETKARTQAQSDADALRTQQSRIEAKVAALEARLSELDALQAERERLAGELDTHKVRLADFERLTSEHRETLESIKAERDLLSDQKSAELAALTEQLTSSESQAKELASLRDEVASLKTALEQATTEKAQATAEHDAETVSLREQLEVAQSQAEELESLRAALEIVQEDRNRLVDELKAATTRQVDPEGPTTEWGLHSTEIDIPALNGEAPTETRTQVVPEVESETETEFDNNAENVTRAATSARMSHSIQAEHEALKASLVDLAERLEEKESEHAEAMEQIQRARNESMEFRRALYEARLEAETNGRARNELVERVRVLEAETAHAVQKLAAPTIDPAVAEAERVKAVEEAVKAAWADFERRLSETQSKLQAANARADMMEAEAREAREQIAARERAKDAVGDGSSFGGGEAGSMTTLRILDARGTPRLSQSDADARLELARKLAVERKDKALIDRINKMSAKVKSDLEARNYTLAETLVRGAEIEVGLDPGGFSIHGQRIFRPSPTVVGNLNGLHATFDRVMRDGDPEAIQDTIEEMKTILGDQAGLPEMRRPGRIPSTKRPITRPEGFRLFMDALVAESWLVKPVVQKKPLPDTSLGTYAGLIEATCLARDAARAFDNEQVSFLEEIIAACCQMLTRRQQIDGHFPFLDPRGKPSREASAVEGMVAQRSDAVKEGWVVHVDPIGLAQIETGPCGHALAIAGKSLERDEWFLAGQRAVEWALGQPCLPNFVANATSLGLLAQSYVDTGEDPHLFGLIRKLNIGLLPGQAENGRWLDPASAATPRHLIVLRALHDAWSALPENARDMKQSLKTSIDAAMGSLLEECKAIGVPAQGQAIRELIRHRDLFPESHDPWISVAILDSASLIQELCHDGHRPRLGVAAEHLAALMRI